MIMRWMARPRKSIEPKITIPVPVSIKREDGSSIDREKVFLVMVSLADPMDKPSIIAWWQGGFQNLRYNNRFKAIEESLLSAGF